MNWISETEGELESAEQEVEQLEDEKQKLDIRENMLETALQNLSDDIEVALSLRENTSKLDLEKLDNQQRVDMIRQKIQDIQMQLQEMVDQNTNSRSVLQELSVIGEDITEGLLVLEERQMLIDSCNQRLQELAERLDMDAGLSELSQGNNQAVETGAESGAREEAALEESELPNSRQSVFQNSDFRPLTQQEIRAVQARTGMSDASIGRCSINADGVVKMRCIHEDLLGQPLPAPYVEQIVDVNGVKVSVVMPQFPDIRFRVQLPTDMFRANDYQQFKHCVSALKQEITCHPEMQIQFTKRQLQQIMAEETVITGLVWHHGAQCGDMQLIPVKWHDKYRHTGGKAIWGGGRP